jgi:DNA modification methylase
MKIEKIAIDKLLLDPANARKHGQKNLDSIKGSLAKFGQQKPIVVNADNVIVAGNGTMQAAKELGWKEINIVRTDLKGSDITAFGIADNRTSELAEWDDKVLQELLEGLKAEDFDLSAIGFDIDDMNEMIGDKNKAGLTDPDDVPEPPKVPITKLGDIWQLGNHRLMCGDSTSIDAVENLLDGEKIDLVFTDPPYGVDYQGINNDDRGGLHDLLDQAFNNYNLSMKAGASIYVFHSDKCADIFHDVFRKYFHFSSMIIWVKPALVLSQSDYHSRHEPCMYGWNKEGPHNWRSDRKQTTVWEYGKEHIEGHTTPKPTKMICYALENSSKSGNIVCDLFGGSGSTLIACEKTGRHARLMELEPIYCDVIINRWEDFTGKKAVLINAN